MKDGGESIKCPEKNGLMISFMIYNLRVCTLRTSSLPFIFSRCIGTGEKSIIHRKENGRNCNVKNGCNKETFWFKRYG